MTLYGFNKKDTTVRLRDFSDEILANKPIGAVGPTGREERYCKVSGDPIDAADHSADPPEFGIGRAMRMITLSDGRMIENPNGYTMEIFNTTEKELAVDDIVQVVREGKKWMVTGGGGGSAGIKFLKFQLIEPTRVEASPHESGDANAIVIDPLNSGYNVGDQILVYDMAKEFQFSHPGSIGIAYWTTKFVEDWMTTSPPSTVSPGRCDISNLLTTESACDGAGGTWEEGVWEIESCTQLVTEIEVEVSDSIAKWYTGDITGTISAAKGSWPHVMWKDQDEYNGAQVMLQNVHGFTANPGRCYAQRINLSQTTQDPTIVGVPYAGSDQEFEWHIKSVQNPTARQAQVKWDGSAWILDATLQDEWKEGEDPKLNDHVQTTAQMLPPFENEDWCMIPDDTLGWGLLDDNDGYYNCVATFSSMLGPPTKVSGVMKLEDDTDELIDNVESDSPGNAGESCGKITYKELQNVYIFGDPNSSGPNTCPLELLDPPREIDLYENAVDMTVVRSVTLDDGKLVMSTADIKVCGEIGEPTEITLPTDCNCDYYDIQYPDHPYIDYYDILWPDGCEPCDPASGCCTVEYGNGDPDQVTRSVTSDWCSAQAGLQGSVTNTTWTEGPCSCCVGGDADGEDVTQDICEDGGGVWTEGECPGEDACLDSCNVCSGNVELTNLGVAWQNVDHNGSGGYDGRIVQASVEIEGHSTCEWAVNGIAESDDPAISPINVVCTVTVVTEDRLDLSWTPSSFAGVTFPTRADGQFGVCDQPFGFGYGGVTPTDPGGSGTWNEVVLDIDSCTPTA